jgi:hypothetical protein
MTLTVDRPAVRPYFPRRAPVVDSTVRVCVAGILAVAFVHAAPRRIHRARRSDRVHRAASPSHFAGASRHSHQSQSSSSARQAINPDTNGTILSDADTTASPARPHDLAARCRLYVSDPVFGVGPGEFPAAEGMLWRSLSGNWGWRSMECGSQQLHPGRAELGSRVSSLLAIISTTFGLLRRLSRSEAVDELDVCPRSARVDRGAGGFVVGRLSVSRVCRELFYTTWPWPPGCRRWRDESCDELRRSARASPRFRWRALCAPRPSRPGCRQ